MKIKDILRQKGATVQTVAPDASVQDAMSLLVEHNIGSLIVRKKGGDIVGIITERDILRQCAASGDHDPDKTRVSDVMTADLIIGVPDDDLEYVMGIMTKNRIRHLPVLDGGELEGIISIGDVVNAHLHETKFENRLLRDYIHGVKA